MLSEQVSIVIPVYNVEKYLERFLDGLNHQTFSNFVAIFIDDGSTDHSLSIIEKYKDACSHKVVVIRNNENIGQGKTRNVGLDYVEEHPTKYITFLDPDDWMDNDYLEDLYNIAESNNLDVCISGLERFNDDDGKTICMEMVNMSRNVYEKATDCHELAYINPCLYSKIFLFERVKDIRFNDMKRSEDTCYVFEALCKCGRLQFTNNARYHYCVRNSSLTGVMNVDTYKSMHKGFARTFSKYGYDNLMRDIFISQVFIRSSIGGVCRLSFGNMKNVRKLEKRELKYLDEFIPGWSDCFYLNFHRKGYGGLKGVALVICAKLYRLHLFFLFVYFYYFVSRVLRVEVRM